MFNLVLQIDSKNVLPCFTEWLKECFTLFYRMTQRDLVEPACYLASSTSLQARNAKLVWRWNFKKSLKTRLPLKFEKILIVLYCAVECRNPNIINPNNAESRMIDRLNRSSSDFSRSGLSFFFQTKKAAKLDRL